MRCFVIRIGAATFALPEDTGLCIQDLLLQAIPLRQSFKREFYWKEDEGNDDRTLELQEIEQEAEQEAEPEILQRVEASEAELLEQRKAVDAELKIIRNADSLLNELVTSPSTPSTSLR